MSNPQTDTSPRQQAKGQGRNGNVPPVEYRFKPGQSGNPAGSPKAKTNLYKHIGKYSAMTDAELAKLDQESLTQSQKAALKIVQDMAAGNRTGAEGMARYIVDREEGKTPERIITDQEQNLVMSADDRAMLQAIAKEFYHRRQIASVPGAPE